MIRKEAEELVKNSPNLNKNDRLNIADGSKVISFADVNIEGLEVEVMKSFSSTKNLSKDFPNFKGFSDFIEPEERVLSTFNFDIVERAAYAEAKLFEQLVRITDQSSKGVVRLVVGRNSCDSCRNVANQFAKLRPGVDIEVAQKRQNIDDE